MLAQVSEEENKIYESLMDTEEIIGLEILTQEESVLDKLFGSKKSEIDNLKVVEDYIKQMEDPTKEVLDARDKLKALLYVNLKVIEVESSIADALATKIDQGDYVV